MAGVQESMRLCLFLDCEMTFPGCEAFVSSINDTQYGTEKRCIAS